MKRFFSIAALISLTLFAASCEKDTVSSNENVQFNVIVPAQPATRALMSDGTTANELYYEVFVANELMYEGVIDALPTLNSNGYRQFAFELQLVKGQEYDILFWAQKKGTGYYNTTDLRAVSTDYAGALANDEARDAFYGALKGYDVADGDQTVNLTRPFAQINCAITPADWNTVTPFIKNGLKSKYVMSELPTTFNVYTGDVIAGATVKDVVMDLNLSPVSETTYTNDVINYNNTDYTWVAMAYVFAPAAGNSIDIKAHFVHDKNNSTSPIEVEVSSVNTKRNYKTNIFGQMLSVINDITVVVVPGFENENNSDPDYIINK